MNSRIKLLNNFKLHLLIVLICISVFADAQHLNLSLSAKDITCHGRSDGAIESTVNGGNAPYKFSWSNGATTQNISGLPEGTYSVTVQDNIGSTISSTAIVKESSMNATVTTTDETCYNRQDGTLRVTVNGGKPPFTFLWIPKNDPALIDSSLIQTEKRSLFVDSLSSMSGEVLIKDINGCTTKASVTITSPDPIPISVKKNNITCYGEADGSIDITVEKKKTFSYKWSNGKSAQDISNLEKGVYTLTITDHDKNCKEILEERITEPLRLSSSIFSPAICKNLDGFIEMDVTGGNAPYSYLWSNGDTAKTIASLSSGKYTVTITDHNGCTISDSTEIRIASNMSASFNSNHVKCSGDSDGLIDLYISGGTMPYSYSWSNGDTTSTIANLSAGTYYVTVTDDIDCSIIDSVTINETEKISLSLKGTKASCAGRPTGSAEVKATGGTPPYLFEWSNYSNATSIDSIAPGRYYITVTDMNSCVAIDSIDIGKEIFSVKIQGKHECNGNTDGRTEVMLSGGLEPYSFYWDDGIKERKRDSLSAGTYSVYVIENQGCTDRDTIVLRNLNLSSQLTVTNPSRPKAKDGSLKLTVSGDAPPFFYFWSTGDTTKDINDLSAGSYLVTVTDSNECSVSASEDVN